MSGRSTISASRPPHSSANGFENVLTRGLLVGKDSAPWNGRAEPPLAPALRSVRAAIDQRAA